MITAKETLKITKDYKYNTEIKTFAEAEEWVNNYIDKIVVECAQKGQTVAVITIPFHLKWEIIEQLRDLGYCVTQTYSPQIKISWGE